jgi:hypothetical protein
MKFVSFLWLFGVLVVTTDWLQGGREVSDFIDFIKKEATNPPVIKGKKAKDDL